MRRSEFWIYVDYEPRSGCWLWTRYCHPTGYGYAGSPICGERRVPRIAWTLTHGPIRPGMMVCHKCDVPACFNPAHLYLGNQETNHQDAISRGRKFEWWDDLEDIESVRMLLLETDIRDDFSEYAAITARCSTWNNTR